METERRKLQEILARHENEPSLADVYVEGTFDQEVLSHCFNRNGWGQRIVYEIDTIEIPEDLVKSQGLTNGNKQRVIVLSRLLSALKLEMSCKCLVDRDFDHWRGPLEQNCALVWTEYCSLELYFFTEQIMQEVILTAGRSKIQDWGGFFKSLIETLQDLYAMRLADCELKWCMKWLPLEKHLSVDGSTIRFNSTEYMRRLLLKNGKYSKNGKFRSCYEKWRSSFTGDPRSSIRGHDMIALLAWAMQSFRGVKELANDMAIERIFILAAPRVSEFLALLS